MLGTIRMRQESYRSEFSQYCDVSLAGGAYGSYWPSSPTDRRGQAWGTPTEAGWAQLGVRPTSSVVYQYRVAAGAAGTMGAGVAASTLGYTGDEAWWAAQARGDLDGDSTYSLFEATSFTSGVYSDQEIE